MLNRRFCLILFLAAALAVSWAMTAEAEESGKIVEGDLFLYRVQEDGTAGIIGYRGEERTIEIPAEIDGLPVTEITGFNPRTVSSEMMKAWEDYEDYVIGWNNLTGVTIPESVTRIGDNAFIATKLTEITIPGNVGFIGECAFMGNPLTSVTIMDGVAGIGTSAFLWTLIQDVTIPASVHEIGNEAFAICRNLTGIDVAPDNPVYESVDGVLFEKATRTLVQYPAGKTEEIYEIPSGTIRIGIGAFELDRSGETPAYLQQVVIPDSVTDIGILAFCGQHELRNIIIPDSVAEIGMSAFIGCSAMESVRLPEGLTKIASGTFMNCTGLREIIIPAGVRVIEQHAFDNTGLTSLTVPAGVLSFEYAFCNNLSLREIVFEEGICEISSSAFANCLELTDIRFPGSLRVIGSDAFAYCSRLVSVNLPDSLTTIGYRAFRNCEKLKDVSWFHSADDGKSEDYIPYDERTAMIRFLTSLDVWQRGERMVFAGENSVDAYYKAGGDKEAYRQIMIKDLEQKIAGLRLMISDGEERLKTAIKPAQIKIYNRQIQAWQSDIDEAEGRIEFWREAILVTQDEAEARLKEETGLSADPVCTAALCGAFTEKWEALHGGNGIPEEFPNAEALLNDENGLDLTVLEIRMIQSVSEAIRVETDGTIRYTPVREQGIAVDAFDRCGQLAGPVMLPAGE